MCDRYFYSTYCYQILTSSIPLSTLKYLHSKVTNNLMPDLTLVIDIDFEIGIKEALKEKRRNWFEFKDSLFHQRFLLGLKT